MNINTTLTAAVLALLVVAGGAYWLFTHKGLPTETPTPETTNQMPVVNSGEDPQPGSAVHDLPVEPAAAAARKDLATKLGISESKIVITFIEEKTWSDGCLGLGGPAESCLQALVPGFAVELHAPGTSYLYRTDKTGASVRIEESMQD